MHFQQSPKFDNKERVRVIQGVTKRCRLSWLTNSALVCEPKCGVGPWSQPMSTDEHMEPKKNFEDLISYLTYGVIVYAFT